MKRTSPLTPLGTHPYITSHRGRCGHQGDPAAIRPYRYKYHNEYLCSYDGQYGRKGLPTVQRTDERPSPIVGFSFVTVCRVLENEDKPEDKKTDISFKALI
ncbi:hypothetical protein [Bacillus sp. T33-2]|uniref:hypothetical protein n=1 Tax=Bacillus sp. T33-2 TaxID=2054168 RepID=UPI002155644C|nr:hypothetical protein [Bacillus sp. T33-2]